MQGKLHRHYQIQKALSERGYHQGLISLEALARLASMLQSEQAEIAVRFKVSSSEYDSAMVKGRVETELAIACQHCLKSVMISIDLNFELLIDAKDDVVRESGFDTVYSEHGTVDIFEVVEDELILGLPLVALHEGDSCNEYWQVLDDVPTQVETENPFLVLEKLKTTH